MTKTGKSVTPKLGDRAIEIARALRPAKVTGRNFHVTLIAKNSKILAIGWNNYNRGHSLKRFGKYRGYKNSPEKYRPSLHSEIAACIKLGKESLRGYDLINVRIGNDGRSVLLSKPCKNCANVLRQLRPKRVFFTNDKGNFEKLEI